MSDHPAVNDKPLFLTVIVAAVLVVGATIGIEQATKEEAKADTTHVVTPGEGEHSETPEPHESASLVLQTVDPAVALVRTTLLAAAVAEEQYKALHGSYTADVTKLASVGFVLPAGVVLEGRPPTGDTYCIAAHATEGGASYVISPPGNEVVPGDKCEEQAIS